MEKSEEIFAIGTVLAKATILHSGWDGDNHGFIISTENGIEAFTTSHGQVCPWNRDEAQAKLIETEASALSIRKALEMWPSDQD